MILLESDNWWNTLTLITKLYWLVAIPSSIIFAIQLALSFINPDKKEKVETAEGSPINFNLITFKNLIGLFTAFGWSGLACLDSGLSNESAIITSLICGLAMMLAMAVIVYFMKKLMKTVSEELE